MSGSARVLGCFALGCLVVGTVALAGSALGSRARAVSLTDETTERDVDFDTEVRPLLEARCVECHQRSHRDENGRLRRPKGKLSLDHAAGLLVGGSEGPAVRAGDPPRSPLWQRVNLAEDHEERMPPDGPPLSLEQRELLRRWIAEGAELGTADSPADADPKANEGSEGAGSPSPNARIPERIRWFAELEEGAPPVADETLEALREQGFRIQRVGPRSDLLELRFPAQERELDAARFAAITPLLQNVVELDLGRCPLAPRLLPTVAEMPRLQRLDLSQTSTDSASLRALQAHPQLRVLNLHGTPIDEDSAATLASLPELRRLYVWDTDLSRDAVEGLRRRRPALQVQWKLELPAPLPQESGRRRR